MYYSYNPYAPAYACSYCPYMGMEGYKQESIEDKDWARGENELGYKGIEYDPDQQRLIAIPLLLAAGAAAGPRPFYGPRPPYFGPPFYGPRPPYFVPPFYGPRPPYLHRFTY